MGHQVTITNAEAVGLAQELAAMTGESVGVAVTEAVRRRIPSPLPSAGFAGFHDETTGLPR